MIIRKYTVTEIIDLPPNVVGEIKTLKKIGYSLETSVADIIDNSIAAQAKNIEIEIPYSVKAAPAFISIKDDGFGMTKKELIENMRLGCKDPDDEREPGDLGRFGSGMKTASFSQANKLIVISKAEGKPAHGAIWDTERVIKEKKWILEVLSPKEVSEISNLRINEGDKSGTQVIWLNMDRYSKDREDSHTVIDKELTKDLNKIKNAIALLFHRYLDKSGEDKDLKKINVLINGVKIQAFDPFMKIYPGYEQTGTSILYDKGEQINIKIHNIPHLSKLTAQQKKEVGGEENYNAKQGFYIYRNKRLMIPGDWLGTHAAGVLGNRARVQVDIPSKMDDIYGTDVKKASFQFPPTFKRHLAGLGRVAQSDSKKDYIRRSKSTAAVNAFWDEKTEPEKGTIQYRVSTKNDDLKAIINNLEKPQRVKVAKFLIALAKNLPLDSILFRMANDRDSIKKYDDWEELLKETLEK